MWRWPWTLGSPGFRSQHCRLLLRPISYTCLAGLGDNTHLMSIGGFKEMTHESNSSQCPAHSHLLSNRNHIKVWVRNPWQRDQEHRMLVMSQWTKCSLQTKALWDLASNTTSSRAESVIKSFSCLRWCMHVSQLSRGWNRWTTKSRSAWAI